MWKIADVKKLIDSLKCGRIVPPVIIAEKDGKNYLLDGQQRLSSILLAYFDIFPKLNESTRNNVLTSDTNVFEEDNEITTEIENAIRWTFKIIVDQFNNNEFDIERTKNKLQRSSLLYDNPGYEYEDTFFDDNFIGYVFQKRMPGAAINASEHFAQTFHTINSEGVKLTHHESRRAYYWLKPGLNKIFEPNFTKHIFVEQEVGKKYVIDFVRPLAFAVEHFVARGENFSATPTVARGHGRKFEEYFTNFVKRAGGLDTSDSYKCFGDIGTIIPEASIEMRFAHLNGLLTAHNFLCEFRAAYEYDYYFFGLVYWTIVRGRELSIPAPQELKRKVEAEIEIFRSNTDNTDKYNTLGRIRNRMKFSIETFHQYISAGA